MNPTVSLVDPWDDDKFDAAAMPVLAVALAELFCSDKESAAEFNRPVKFPPDSDGALFNGCSGCVGSELRVKETPNRS